MEVVSELESPVDLLHETLKSDIMIKIGNNFFMILPSVCDDLHGHLVFKECRHDHTEHFCLEEGKLFR